MQSSAVRRFQVETDVINSDMAYSFYVTKNILSTILQSGLQI